jgi:hypothetical protein
MQVRRRLRRRRCEHATQTYEVDGFEQVLLLLLGPCLVVMGIVVLVVGEIEGLLPLFAGLWSLFLGLRMPHRVTLDDDGVRIEAIGRRVRIPWGELEAVAPPAWDLMHRRLRWRRRRGLGVSTPHAFPELHRMLVEIEQRAPHVYVES